MAELRIGTCSWKFPSWHGLVYSAPKGIDYLAEYAIKYDTVEIDQWFWSLFGESIRLPDPADVARYRESVPDGFRFTVKVPNSITLTHRYRKAKARPLVANPYFLAPALFEAFVSLLTPLDGLLGPLMFQFEYLNREKMATQQLFQEQLERFREHLPETYQFGVEVRNAQYLNSSYFEFLARARFSPILLDGYWMPPLTEVYRQWRPWAADCEFVVIRLLGPDRKGIEKRTGKRWDRIVSPRSQQLDDIAGIAGDLLELGVDVYVNVNNHYEGSAPLTIERLDGLLRPQQAM
jgi:uncharacterized protein YecE (DUF72 family)